MGTSFKEMANEIVNINQCSKSTERAGRTRRVDEKIFTFMIQTRCNYISRGPYWPGPIWASIWKWSCGNPITGYFPGVWKYGQFTSGHIGHTKMPLFEGQYGCLFSRCRKYAINSLIHGHFHIGLVIIPRPILARDGPRRRRGPIWVSGW
jgi:hypothetical protein